MLSTCQSVICKIFLTSILIYEHVLANNQISFSCTNKVMRHYGLASFQPMETVNLYIGNYPSSKIFTYWSELNIIGRMWPTTAITHPCKKREKKSRRELTSKNCSSTQQLVCPRTTVLWNQANAKLHSDERWHLPLTERWRKEERFL